MIFFLYHFCKNNYKNRMYKRFPTICRVFPPCRLRIGKFKLTQERVFSVHLSKSMKRAPMQPL